MRGIWGRSSLSRLARYDTARVYPPRQVVIAGRRGDLQHVEDRLDPLRIPVRVDERRHHFDWRPSSAISKYTLAFAKNLIRLAQFTILALKRLFSLGHLAGGIRTHVAVDLSLLDPLGMSMRLPAGLRRDRHHAPPTRSVPPLIIEDQPPGAFPHFRGHFVRCMAYDAASHS